MGSARIRYAPAGIVAYDRRGLTGAKVRLSLTLLAVLAVFAVLLVFTAPVSAESIPETPEPQETIASPVDTGQVDAETPPPPADPGTGETEATGEPVQEPPAGSDEQEPVEELPVMPTETPTAEPSGPVTGEPDNPDQPGESDLEVVQSLAENQLTLADEDGQPLAMAASQTAEIIANPDPYYVVGKTTYYFLYDCTGKTNCTTVPAGENPIQYAIDHMEETGLPTDRTIYVKEGVFDGDVNLDGSKAPLAGLKAIKGSGSSASTINGKVTVSGTTAGFTLSGFTILDQVTFSNNTGALNLSDLVIRGSSDVGLQITGQKGAVTIKDVSVGQSSGSGAEIDNTAVTANVSLTNSSFNHNGTSAATGLKINTKGTITLNGVSASYNKGTGADLTTQAGLSVKNSSFTANANDPDVSESGYGLVLRSSKGNASLDNVYANSNDLDGLSLETTGTVSVKNTQAKTNGGMGLWVATRGNVSLAGLTLVGNSAGGAEVNNCLESSGVCAGTGSITVSSFTAQANSGGPGLSAYSKNTISLTDVNITGNASGALLENWYSGSPNVTIVRGVFDENSAGWGLVVNTNGQITFNAGSASGNGSGGASLDNSSAPTPRNVVMTGVTASSNLNDSGIVIVSKGSVTLTNLSASSNNGLGLDVNNNAGTGNVTITSSTKTQHLFNDNSSTAIGVTTRGAVTINYVNASQNGGGIYVDNSASPSKLGVTLTYIAADGSSGSGITVYSRGNVTLTNTGASDQYGSGVEIGYYDEEDPLNVILAKTVSITNKVLNGIYGVYTGNGGHGLYILATGPVTVQLVDVSGNGGHGIWVDHTWNGASGNISIGAAGSRANVSFNTSGGLHVYSKGAITLSKVDAFWNGGIGADLRNTLAAKPASVTVSDGFFSYNSSGLVINSKGNVTLSGVRADNNSIHSGNIIENTYIDDFQDGFEHDQYYFDVETGGTYTVTIESRSAYFQPWLEVFDENSLLFEGNDPVGGVYAPSISYVLAASPGQYRLVVHDQGHEDDPWRDGGAYRITVTASGGTAVAQPVMNYGVFVDNCQADELSGACTGSGTVAVKKGAGGVGVVATRNGNDGLYIRSRGTVSVANVDNEFNGGDGVDIDNSFATSPVTLSAVSADQNIENGLLIRTRGAIKWSSGTANENGSVDGGASGADLDNSSAVTPQAVSLSGVTLNSNMGSGLDVVTRGAISLSSVQADGNGYNAASTERFGAQLDNSAAAASLGISLTNTFFNNNGGLGLEILTKGSITVKNGSANGNAAGALLRNDFAGATGNISIQATSGSVSFSSNTNGAGLVVNTFGTITLKNVTASGNTGGKGAVLDNSGAAAARAVSITNGAFNTNTGASSGGLDVKSRGAVTISTVEASGNGDTGAVIDNSLAPLTAVQNVSVSRGTFNANTSADLSAGGLTVLSNGTIAVNWIVAGGNSSHGARLDNHTGANGGVTVSSSYGENTFDGNGGIGLDIWTNKNVSISKINARQNGGVGAMILSTAGTVAVTTGRLESNGDSGLHIDAGRAVTLNGISAFLNGTAGSGGDGLTVIAHNAPITILNSAMSNNAGSGIWVDLDAGYGLKLSNTTYFGNDTDLSGDLDLVMQ